MCPVDYKYILLIIIMHRFDPNQHKVTLISQRYNYNVKNMKINILILV